MALKLYEISDHISKLNEMLENGEEGLEDTLESLDMAFEDKVESILKFWRSKKVEAEAIKAEETRLADRRKRVEKEAEWLHQYVEREMVRLGKEKIKSPLFTVSMRLNPPSVSVLDKSLIPSAYFTVSEPTLSKSKILEEYKAGNIVPGVEIRQLRSLQIR